MGMLDSNHGLDNALAGLHGLSFVDFAVLYHLSRAPGSKLRQIDLAERLGVTASGVTRTLLPLEKLGLVARESDPRDAQVAHAILTAPGRELLGHALVTATQLSDDLTQSASACQLDEFAFLLGKLSDAAARFGRSVTMSRCASRVHPPDSEASGFGMLKSRRPTVPADFDAARLAKR